MTSDLTRGAYSGKETVFEYDTAATWAAPTWATIIRARNITVNDGPALSDVEFHGAPNTSQIPGYAAFNGSFEYVRKRGTDAIFGALETARKNGDIIHLRHLNGSPLLDESIGWKAPCLLGEFAETNNGGDATVVTIPFSLADAYDAGNNAIGVEPDTGTTPP